MPVTSHDHPLSCGDAVHPVTEGVSERAGGDDHLIWSRESGASRARTDDLRHAMAALSQLSYSPFEIEVIGKVNA